ncbi:MULTISPECIES: hypothetical protein [Alphaproteobacteria]|uniref:hypothetical protein n=1 Tax=Sphingopyxis sp. TaxID=1908224 RepID=UPI004033E5CD
MDDNNPKPGSRRFTIETLAAGQPRAYADTIHHVRVFLEHVPYGGEGGWQPNANLAVEPVQKILAGLQCGFTDFKYPPADRESTTEDYFRAHLDWIRSTAPGVWEFHTTSAYTG